ncbi:MAG: transporter substrate-binding domain-containing protein, partial [Eubacteriales bacterium]|nr:transporter substrate-binding domain-containing protein [Eubacteriales bacterium]
TMDTLRKVFAFILLFGIAAGLLVGCGFDSGKELKELEDFEQAKIGVMTGSSQSVIAKKRFPEAQLVYFSRPADMVLAVEQGKIDCYMLGSPFLAVTLWENARVKRIEEAVAQGDIAFAFSKDGSGGNLRAQLNEFLRQAKADGTLEYLEEKWLGDTEPTEHPDYKSLTGENGTIRLAAVAENKPLIYQYRDQCTGYEMELLTIFARQYGYRFEIEIVPFDSVIMGMATGKYDMTSAGLQITPERAESVSFSDPYTQFDVVLVVRDDGAPRSQFSTLADLENATIGIATGTSWDIVAQKRFPNAERMYFTSSADLLLALEHGRIDTFLTDRTVFVGMNWENAAITSIDEPIMTVSNALLFAKEGYDENLLRQVNEFVAASKADGTLERLENKWFVDEEPTEHPDYQSLTGENGTIKVAAVDYMKPAMYKKGSQYTGYEVDFLTLFAEKYGYKLHIEGMIFEALIPSVISGRFDIGACGITITPERSESVTFADSHFETYGVAVIRDESADTRSASRAIQSIDDLQGGNIAVLTGSIWDGVAREKLPDVDIRYFSSMADMLLSVEQGKVNACLGDRTFYVNARWEDVPVSILDDTVGHISCGFMLAKENYDAVLLEQLNGFIAQSRENGFIDSLADKWLSEAEPSVHPDYQSLTGENGTLKIAVGDTLKPMTYLKNGAYTGLDVDFLTEFARSCGYRLEFVGMAFDALIPTVASGKCDIAACGTAITTERAESVMFSDCYLEVDGVLIVSEKTETAAQNSFFDDLSESFEK